MAQEDRPEFHTVKETARILRIGENQTYNAIQRGEIKAVRIGASYRIPEAEIARLKRGDSRDE